MAAKTAKVGFIDWSERLIVLALYGWLVARTVASWWLAGGGASLLLLPSEGLVVVLLMIRRPAAAMSKRPIDWLLAFGATWAPLLVTPGIGLALISPALGAVVLLMGLLIQLHAEITLGRSLGCVPAHRGLKLAGPYRFVRHPMYAGYLLCHVAFLVMNPTPWNFAVYLSCYALQIPRLLAEERLLNEDPVYRNYRSVVRFRLIPGVF